MTSSSAKIGQGDLLFMAQIDVHQRSNNHHRLFGSGQKCANTHHKFTKKAKKLHLMTPSSTNIGHNDLILAMQVEGHVVIDKQHRPLSYCQRNLYRPLTHSENRLKCALDDPISP